MEPKAYRKIINSWAMYDWANSAFATIIMATLFPPFYRAMAINAGLTEASATTAWAYTTVVALCIVAFSGPVLGSLADHTGHRKLYIATFAGLGIFGSALLAFLGKDAYLLGSIIFILSYLGFAGSNIFYESLLPYIAKQEDIDWVSAKGYALGYLGGGILLGINALWVMRPEWFFLADKTTAVRLAFLSVAVWWVLFSVFLFRNVPEPPNSKAGKLKKDAVRKSFTHLIETFKKIKNYRELFLFLVAFWLYSDGIGTIIKMATAYGDEIGIGVTDMLLAILVTQFVGIPCTFGFGWLAGRLGTKRSIVLGLAIYTVICIGGMFMQTAVDFYILAIMVGLTQGGTQALSRSLYARMVPRQYASEFFGFFSTSSRFAGIFGPLIFGTITIMAGGSRLSILALILFFIAGGVLLTRVNEEQGIRSAQREWTNT